MTTVSIGTFCLCLCSYSSSESEALKEFFLSDFQSVCLCLYVCECVQSLFAGSELNYKEEALTCGQCTEKMSEVIVG